MGRFIIKQTSNDGFMFNLLANNGQVICTSQVYASMATCRTGVESVRRNCGSDTEDQTLREPESKKNPKYEIYLDAGGKYRFRLKASNGEIVAASQGYTDKSSCRNGIRSVADNAPDAEVVVMEPDA